MVKFTVSTATSKARGNQQSYGTNENHQDITDLENNSPVISLWDVIP